MRAFTIAFAVLPCALVLTLAAPGVVSAANITNGSSISGTISEDGEVDTHSFGGTAGESGVISISGDIPGGEYYRIYNPDGTYLTGSSSQEFLTLPQTGTYSVQVTSFQSRGTGRYTVHLALVLPLMVIGVGSLELVEGVGLEDGHQP